MIRRWAPGAVLLALSLAATSQARAEEGCPQPGDPPPPPLMAGETPPPPPPLPPRRLPIVVRPLLEQTPTAEEMTAVLPERGFMGGSAMIECLVKADGGLEACRVMRQLPICRGFGEAALALAPRFRLKMTNADGEPLTVGASVALPVRWIVE